MRSYADKNGKDKPARKPREVGESYDAPFVGYINLSLSDDDKQRFSSWLSSAAPVDQLEAFTADGVNFSLKFEPKSSGFLASATQRRANSPNAGYCVTARAREAHVAFWRVVYCVTLLSRAERWTDVQPAADPDRW